jgi:hypothetical protein
MAFGRMENLPPRGSVPTGAEYLLRHGYRFLRLAA